MIISWSLVAVALLTLGVCAVVIVYACCVVAGRADDWAEQHDGVRRS
jgi:Na+-translocating ferredoxin:NAD+ oxidoreductase RnfE subunit